MIEVKSDAEALQIFEADIKCYESESGKKRCNNCFIFPLIRKTGDCAAAVYAAEKYTIDKIRNRQNRRP